MKKQTPEEKLAAKEQAADLKKANRSLDALIKRARKKGALLGIRYANNSGATLTIKDLFFTAWVLDTGHD